MTTHRRSNVAGPQTPPPRLCPSCRVRLTWCPEDPNRPFWSCPRCEHCEPGTWSAFGPGLPAPQQGASWRAIRRGDGQITGYLEMWSAAGRWCTIPGASRHCDRYGRLAR